MSASTKLRWLDWLPLIGMVITVAGLIWAGSQYAAEIRDDTRRIAKLEDKADTIQQIDVRTARIEATLDVMKARGK